MNDSYHKMGLEKRGEGGAKHQVLYYCVSKDSSKLVDLQIYIVSISVS